MIAFLPPGDVEIVDTWHVTGLETGGRSARPQGLRAGRVDRRLAMPGARVRSGSTLARIPFMTALGVRSPPSAWASPAAIDSSGWRCGRPFAPSERQVQAQVGLARAEALLGVRALLLVRTWSASGRRSRARGVSLDDRAGVRLASLTAAKIAWSWTPSIAWPARPRSSSHRSWALLARRASAQHLRCRTVAGRPGRVLFGLDPATPIMTDVVWHINVLRSRSRPLVG
jgi:hypothetical protein